MGEDVVARYEAEVNWVIIMKIKRIRNWIANSCLNYIILREYLRTFNFI